MLNGNSYFLLKSLKKKKRKDESTVRWRIFFCVCPATRSVNKEMLSGPRSRRYRRRCLNMQFVSRGKCAGGYGVDLTQKCKLSLMGHCFNFDLSVYKNFVQ